MAEQLLDRETFLVGTLRANRKRNPTDVTKKKLKKGDIVARQNDNGVLVLKWKDRRDVLAISSKHMPSMVNVTQRGGDKIEPQVIVDYNAGKSFIDVSDQMNSYNSFSRRSLKWYRKVAFDILLNVAVVNALSLYSRVTNRNIKITEFREAIIEDMLTKRDCVMPAIDIHNLTKCPKTNRCNQCYKDIVTRHGRKIAQKETPRLWTKCSACAKYFCSECFFKMHATKLQ